MQPFAKILNSSTAWLGAIAAAVTSMGVPVPTWLAAAIVGAYGIKEAGAKVADAIKNPQAPSPRSTP